MGFFQTGKRDETRRADSALGRAFSRVGRMLSTDFCPGFNQYVYWMKEPAGWFAGGLLLSLIVGLFVSPLGWTISGALAVLLAAGLFLPWLLVQCTSCSLKPVGTIAREEEDCQLHLVVRNRLPFPVWGLCIENYASPPGDNGLDQTGSPDIALAAVPVFATAQYQLSFRPEYRGIWPMQDPVISCAFPFGLWKARKPLKDVRRIRVWPGQIPVVAEYEPRGRRTALFGEGQRTGSGGQYLGVRSFRMGDSLKDIRWSLSARTEQLVVIERSSPEVPVITIEVMNHSVPGCSDRMLQRTNLLWRVRIAGSLATYFHSRHQPPSLRAPHAMVPSTMGTAGLDRIMDTLTEIPLDPVGASAASTKFASSARIGPTITITTVDSEAGFRDPAGIVLVILSFPQSIGRVPCNAFRKIVDLDTDIGAQLDQLIQEADHASFVNN